jgi:hypothetical protein
MKSIHFVPSARQLRSALLFVVLAGTGVQQLVAQTHWHAMRRGEASITAPAGDSGAKTNDVCLLCQIAAHAGAAAPPTMRLLFTGTHTAFPAVAAHHQADVPAVPSHAWLSRGPPAA